MKHYIGSYRDDGINGPNRGWIVGTFMADVVRKTEALEIKYWEFPEGPTTHDTKTSETIETTFVLTGQIQGTVDDQPVTLSAGQYVVISPGVRNNLVEKIVEEAMGLTIKAPSDPAAKQVVP